jgi:carbon starvation protein
MSGIWLAVFGLGVFFLGFRFYSKYISERIYRLDPDYVTPAHQFNDGVDFVPTQKWVLWGHHFTSVAGAAPIIGPAIALYWGWLPALLWVVFGTAFAAGVHDFGALVLSARNKGQSIGTLCNRLIGKHAKILFLFIILILLLMVNAVFAWAIANLFIKEPGSVLSVFIQIPLAIWVGYAVLKKKGRMLVPALIALAVMYGAAVIATRVEFLQIDVVRYLGGEGATVMGMDAVSMAFLIWIAVLLVYVYFASTLPVWVLLQPRDYINAQQLVVGLLMLYGGMLVLNPELTAPAYNSEATTSWFPLLFITIACGAISGFHGLVASGTSSKQLNKETDARVVGYLGAVGEGTLALIVIIAVATFFGSQGEFFGTYSSFTEAGRSGLGAFVSGAGQLATGLGIPADIARTIVAVIIISFAATTLDTALRLLRYIIAELGTEYKVQWITGRHVASGVAVVLVAALVLLPDGGRGLGSGGFLLWPLFGTANQLLAGITLMLVSLWLWRQGRNPLPTLMPMIFLLFMTIWAMTQQVVFDWSGLGANDAKWLLFVLGAMILGFALWILLEAIMVFRDPKKIAAYESEA